jgi:hypothetical protein
VLALDSRGSRRHRLERRRLVGRPVADPLQRGGKYPGRRRAGARQPGQLSAQRETPAGGGRRRGPDGRRDRRRGARLSARTGPGGARPSRTTGGGRTRRSDPPSPGPSALGLL